MFMQLQLDTVQRRHLVDTLQYSNLHCVFLQETAHSMCVTLQTLIFVFYPHSCGVDIETGVNYL